MVFDPEAAARWISLHSNPQPHEGEVRRTVAGVLRQLAVHPERHRVGAAQFATTPTTWARTVEISGGAVWMVVWTVDAEDLRILRIEPAPSF